jgi:hypothetical protein
MNTTTRIAIFLVAVASVVAVLVFTGWGDGRAAPGSGGRVPVSTASPPPR